MRENSVRVEFSCSNNFMMLEAVNRIDILCSK